jgi:hypothetical protein
MGWFSSGPKDDGGPAKTSGGAFESPSRSNRKQCYAARDAFFECLDKNNVLDSINTKSGRDKAQSFCSQLDQEFEKNCAHSWVSEVALVVGSLGPGAQGTGSRDSFVHDNVPASALQPRPVEEA